MLCMLQHIRHRNEIVRVSLPVNSLQPARSNSDAVARLAPSGACFIEFQTLGIKTGLFKQARKQSGRSSDVQASPTTDKLDNPISITP